MVNIVSSAITYFEAGLQRHFWMKAATAVGTLLLVNTLLGVPALGYPGIGGFTAYYLLGSASQALRTVGATATSIATVGVFVPDLVTYRQGASIMQTAILLAMAFGGALSGLILIVTGRVLTAAYVLVFTCLAIFLTSALLLLILQQ